MGDSLCKTLDLSPGEMGKGGMTTRKCIAMNMRHASLQKRLLSCFCTQTVQSADSADSATTRTVSKTEMEAVKWECT